MYWQRLGAVTRRMKTITGCTDYRMINAAIGFPRAAGAIFFESGGAYSIFSCCEIHQSTSNSCQWITYGYPTTCRLFMITVDQFPNHFSWGIGFSRAAGANFFENNALIPIF